MNIRFPNGKELRLLIGDITQIRVDALVNAANAGLSGGGGVDGAVHQAGGPSIMRELDEIRKRIRHCPPGDAVMTGAGSLPAQYVIHTVGPVYRDGSHGEPEQLKRCYRRCLEIAEEHGLRSISFPALSTGAYRYPLSEAAEIALHSLADSLSNTEGGIREVLFVLYDKHSYDMHCAVAMKDYRNSVQ